jgi:hypothetical protein
MLGYLLAFLEGLFFSDNCQFDRAQYNHICRSSEISHILREPVNYKTSHVVKHVCVLHKYKDKALWTCIITNSKCTLE